jgi:negative regulator of flagellin synthesis FlgM
MPIEISGHSASLLSSTHEGSGAKPEDINNAEQKTNQAATGSSNDTVSLTGSAGLMNKMESIIVKTPVVDTQRVDSIRKALVGGTYEINPAQIAEKMLRFESLLNG